MFDSVNNNKIWKLALPNISKMMQRRNLSFQQKINDFSLLFFDNENNKPYILICIFMKKVGVDNLKKHLKQSCTENVKNYIIIYEKQMTSTCQKIIKDLFQYNIELFTSNEFCYDITELFYYLPHQKIIDKTILLDLQQRYDNKFPLINENDPVCRYFGFKKNDLIRITRSPEEISYRLVK